MDVSTRTLIERSRTYPREHEYVFRGEGRVVYVIARSLEYARNVLAEKHADLASAPCVGRYSPDGTFVRIDS